MLPLTLQPVWQVAIVVVVDIVVRPLGVAYRIESENLTVHLVLLVGLCDRRTCRIVAKENFYFSIASAFAIYLCDENGRNKEK